MLRSLAGVLLAVVFVVDCGVGSSGPTWSVVLDLDMLRIVVEG